MKAERLRPSCTIIGGPNGSGKSRIYELLRPDGVLIKADVVARTIDPRAPETVSLAAGRQVLHSLEGLVHARQDFVFETTLSSNQAIALMRRARSAGDIVGLVFVVLANVELNVRRVAERVGRGGTTSPKP